MRNESVVFTSWIFLPNTLTVASVLFNVADVLFSAP